MKRIFTLSMAILCLLVMAACGGTDGGGSNSPAASTPPAESQPAESLSADTDTASANGSEDWAYIEGKGKMIIGITYFEPMNYLDDSGQLTGFETEFAQAVCEILGVEPEFQEISWAAKETELNAKNIDCIWNGMTIDDERKANMSITNPYMQNKQVLLVKAENAAAYGQSVEGLTIVAEAGSAGESICQEEDFFTGANYTAVDTQAKGLMEVASGTADGCVVDYVLSIGMIGEGTDFSDLVVVEERSFGEEEYGIAFRKQDAETTQKVNDAIKQLIDNGKLIEIADKYKLTDLIITQ